MIALTHILGPLIAYLLGSIPFAYIVVKVFGGKDIREYGSGNVGATNVARVMGWHYGAVVFLLDMLKGLVPVYVASRYLSGQGFADLPVVLCGFGAILGHVFPLYLRFQGGKAAATSFGVFLWLAPQALGVALVVWVITVALSRYVSLGTMLAAASFCVVIVTLSHDPFGEGIYLTAFSFAIALLVIIRHKENISRLRAGTERKIGQKESSV